jgi:CBS domain containing-hemolysin-like protein
MDNIVGIVNSKDLEHLNNQELSQELEQLKTAISGKNNSQRALNGRQESEEKTLDLNSLAFEATFVPETIRIDILLTQFKKRRQQIAIVIDEYGGTAGLVTLADLLEEVFGDLPDEAGEKEPEIVKRPDGSIQLAGRVSIDEVNELFGFGFPSNEAVTMGGLVLDALDRTASIGDEVIINGLRIRVEKVDRFRIETLGLYFPPKKTDETASTQAE